MPPVWLPNIVTLSSFNNNRIKYLEYLYKLYESDFVFSRPVFNGVALSVKRHPSIKKPPFTNGMDATFWHIVSSGNDQVNRSYDFLRCERIRWPKQIVENASDPAIKQWKNRRGRDKRICLWLEEEDYVVILAERSAYTLFYTAYVVTYEHQRKKFQKEYEKYQELRS